MRGQTRSLLIVAVDAVSGEPVVWDRDANVSLVSAVTASSAFPGASPPIRVRDRWYIDGGLRSCTNADLAAGSRILIVVEPLAHLFPREILRRELEVARASTTVTLAPDPASLRTFGPSLYERESWNPAYEAGLDQAEARRGVMDSDVVVPEALIESTAEAIRGRNIRVMVVSTKAEALSRLKEMIPSGASVSTGFSRTLKEIGFEDLLKSGDHPWRNFKAEIAAETDFDKQMAVRKQSTLADYYIGSVNAIAATGEIVFGSTSGSQIAPYAYDSSNPIWVAGAQKITPDLESALRRVRQYVAPLLDKQMKEATGGRMGSPIGKVLIFEREDPVVLHRTVTLLLVREKVGV